jgi:hypothetical protein
MLRGARLTRHRPPRMLPKRRLALDHLPRLAGALSVSTDEPVREPAAEDGLPRSWASLAPVRRRDRSTERQPNGVSVTRRVTTGGRLARRSSTHRFERHQRDTVVTFFAGDQRHVLRADRVG